nr:FecR domain-containing protein [Sphingobium sp. BYY-5]
MRYPLDPAAQAELDAWLALDRRHNGALLRAMAGLSIIDRAVAGDQTNDGAAALPYRPSRRGIFMGAGVAIAASVAGIIGWSGLLGGERVSTARGEIRRLPLADGSVATINTDSALRVVFASDARRVALDRGEAWFQVAKDRKRPFVVDAGIAQIRAVGTAFSVDRSADNVRITVTEGVVAVWPSQASGMMTILEAGQYANFRNAATQPDTGTAPETIERALAWRSGEISLENETLSHAVAQFNRYNSQKLIIADASLENERLIGLFRIDQPGDFAATLAASLHVSVDSTPTEIRLSRKKSPVP